MKEGDKEGREGEREGDELMELLLGIFFALSLVERGRQAPACLWPPPSSGQAKTVQETHSTTLFSKQCLPISYLMAICVASLLFVITSS